MQPVIRTRGWAVVLLTPAVVLAAACSWLDSGRPSSDASVFTPAHRTTAGAVRDFFGVRAEAIQPIPFPHATHIAKGLTCTDYCHESAAKGPVAGLPSVKTCMICHDAIASDRPIIQRLADYQKRGVDISWQRVYGYTPEAHVRFNHAPHIRAGVECSTCHGDVAQQTVAQRVVDMNMGFCVNCHRTRQVSNDCLTCHF